MEIFSGVSAGKKGDNAKKEHFLCAPYYPEEIERDEEDDKMQYLIGWDGDLFTPPVRVTDFEWFHELKKQQSNFSLGVSEIIDERIIAEMNKLFYSTKTTPSLPEPNELEKSEPITEGLKHTVTVNRYERSIKARKDCIEYYGAKCKVCGFDFEATYGEIGKGYIHVHQTMPISKNGEEYRLDPIKDLISVCPNCHAMFHMGDEYRELFSVDELKEIIKKQKKT